jgi:nucleoside-diphosphate-sugar epimerase
MNQGATVVRPAGDIDPYGGTCRVRRVLVTGASGFVGSILCPILAEAGYAVRAALRTDKSSVNGVAEKAIVGAIDASTDWAEALNGVELVIHLAARAHVLTDDAEHTDLYATTNAHGTGRLAAECTKRAVRRFIYLSSVKVNGEETTGRPYSVEDEPRPLDAYGRSKWLGEKLLWEAAACGPMQAAVVRSPLVYGPGVRANFLRLLRWVDQERWLPVGAVRNGRSLVSVWNLCDLLVRVLEHPAAAGETWMVSDGRDVSTLELVTSIASIMGRRARLLPVPALLLRYVGQMLGKGAEARRLCGSLTVDITRTRERLGWSPPVPISEALARTVTWYQTLGHGPTE